jgi:hypothetical protein
VRQPSRPYLQHGSRHLPGGSDPIPGTGSVPVILAFGSTVVTSSPANDHYVDLSLYATTDDSVFGIAVGTGGLSAINGISIAAAGVYRVFYSFIFSSATNGDTLIAEPHGFDFADSNHWVWANTQQDDDMRVVYSSTAFTGTRRVEYMRVFWVAGVFDPSSGPPSSLFVSARSPAGLNFTVTADLMVERLGPSYTTNGSFGDSP